MKPLIVDGSLVPVRPSRGAKAFSPSGAMLDPIQFEVIRNAVLAATEEMAIALRRSAYSTNIKTRSDFSCAFFDRDLRVTAQAFTQPVHLGSFVELVPQAVRTYGLDRLRPGDMLVTNDPFNGGVHLNDITIIAPVFSDGALIGYLANLVHHVDVGGGAPASIGAFQEIYQEGVIIPVVKLVNQGVIEDDVFRLVLAQMRSKRETAGDFRAQIAANITGERRLHELVERIGCDQLNLYIDGLIDYTHRRTKSELLQLPRGIFSAEGSVDNDGFTDQPVNLCVKIQIDENGVLFDLAGSDLQRRGPVNSTFAMTFSGCAYALKCLIDQDVPVNQGFYDFVHVNAPSGTVTNCRPPAAVVGGWETQARLVDVIFKALAPALPDRALAGTKGMMCQAGFGGIDPRTGEYYCFYEALAGGYGGRNGKDGPDAVQTHGQNTENAPIEEIEVNYPVQITRYELVPDSGGPGRWRGGLGLRRDYFFPGHEVSFTILADRDRAGPWGLFGGEAGQRAEYVLNPDGEARRLSSKTTVQLQPGDVISFRTCGGGGLGPVSERDLEAVLEDVRNGKVSREQARGAYRVEIGAAAIAFDSADTESLPDAYRIVGEDS
jgi:N-methylhydantoinase B